MKLSIIIPVYNEHRTVVQLIQRLHDSGCGSYEWIFVDDGSTDGSVELLKEHVPSHQKIILLDVNAGKTAAVRAGLEHATGQWTIVQDADLEYQPWIIPTMLEVTQLLGVHPIAVYGRRPSYWFNPKRWIFASGVLGVDVLLWWYYGGWVRDHATCYKLMPTELLRSLELTSSGFDGCIEITAKLMTLKVPIKQVAIPYSPRGADEGKKLTLAYALEAWKAVLRYRSWRCRTVTKSESIGRNATCEQYASSPREDLKAVSS
jgi:hypothetical protein